MPRDDDDENDDRPRRRSRRDDNDDDDEEVRPRRRSRRDEDDDSEARPKPNGTNGLATTSLVFGVLSFCTGITSLPGLICGFMGLAKAKKVGVGKGLAIAGILTSLGGMFVSIAVGVGGYLLYLNGVKDREENRSYNNYKQVGIATHAVHDSTDSFPKPYLDESVRDFGPPMPETALKFKLSWRVTLLPFIDQRSLFSRFNRSEPWDSPANKPLSQTVVPSYADADTPLDSLTRLRCFYGNGAVFDLQQKTRLTGITDGTSNTILYVEGAEKVTWTQFNEYKFEPNGPLPALGHPKRDTFSAVFADGSVRQVRKTVNPTTLKALITRAGGEVVVDY